MNGEECSVDDAGDFNCFERECFGDEDGCDAWYYGEDPEDAKQVIGHANMSHVRALQEEGTAVAADRAAKAAMTEDVQERIAALVAKLRAQ